MVKWNRMRRKEVEKVMQILKELVDQLSPDLQQEVRDFVEFLLERRAKKRGENSARIGQAHLGTTVTNIPRWNSRKRL